MLFGQTGAKNLVYNLLNIFRDEISTGVATSCGVFGFCLCVFNKAMYSVCNASLTG